MFFNLAPQYSRVDAEAFRRFDSCLAVIGYRANGIQIEFLRIFLFCVHLSISSF